MSEGHRIRFTSAFHYLHANGESMSTYFGPCCGPTTSRGMKLGTTPMWLACGSISDFWATVVQPLAYTASTSD